MTDIALKASIDFRDAEKQVDNFVKNAKRKMSEIMAAANRPGGSMAGQRSTGTRRTGGAGAASSPIPWMQDISVTKRAYAQLMTLEKAFAEGSIKWRRALERENIARLKRDGAMTEGNFRLKWRLDAEDLRRARARAQEEARIARIRMTGSRAVRFGSGPSASLIDGMFPTEAAIRDRTRRLRAIFEKGAATGTVGRQTGTLGSLIDRQLGLDPASQSKSEALARQMRARMESVFKPATGTVGRQTGTLGSLIDRQLGLDPASQSKSEALARQMRARMESVFKPATGTVGRQTGTILDVINANTNAGTGQRAALAAFYSRLEGAADRSAASSSAAASRSASSLSLASTRAIGSAENTALGVRNRIGRQLGEDPALQARLIGQLDSALAAYSTAVRTYGTRSMEAARATVAWNRELQTVRGTIAEKGGLLRTLNQNTDSLKASIGGLGTGFSSLNRLMLNTQVVLSSLTAAFGLREVLDAIIQYERFSNTLRTVSGSSGEFQRNMSFLFGEANRIGFSVGEVGNAFARLSVAMSGAGFSSDETRRTFTQLAEASRNFGISSADTTGIIRALEQSMSKGKFMAEEVRLQMGDRLPIAMAALQRAMERVDGATVDVNKRFEEGSIDVRRYAVAFVEEINRMSGGAEALQRTATGLSAAFGRLSTEFLSFSQALGEGGLTNATITVTENLRSLMETARESGTLDVLGGALERVANSMNLLIAAGVALGALLAGRMVQGLIAFAATASPLVRVLSAIAGGAVVAFEALDRLTSSTRSANELNSALRDFNTSADQIRGTMGQFSEALVRNNAEMSSSATAVERRIEALRRLGETEAEATRIAAEEERKRMEIRLSSMREDLTRAESAQTAQNRRVIGASGRAFVDGFNNSQALANSPRFNNIGNDASAHVVTRNNAGIQIVTDFTNGVITAREAVRKLNESFAEGTIPRELDAIRRAINEASMSEQFQQSEEAIRKSRREFDLLRQRVDEFAAKYSSAINIQVNMDLIRRELNDAPNAGPGGRNLMSLSGDRDSSGNRTGLDGTISTEVTRNPTVARAAQAIRTALSEHNLDRTIDGGDRFGVDVRRLSDRDLVTTLRGNSLFRTLLPGTASALQGVNINEGGGSGGGTGRGPANAVSEFMDDLRRRTASAGGSDGAMAAYADTLNRLADAARNAGGAVDITKESLEAQALVTERLNKESEKFIRDTDRSSESSERLAQAYLQGAEAGDRAAIRERAMVEARKSVREFTDGTNDVTQEYKDKVEELIPVLERAERSERALATARNIANNRDEIEILQAEQRLISANANEREREVAALRARQAARGTGLEDQAGRSASQVVELRQQNEQLSNSWNEMARVGEQAFDRIGSAITEAFAKGEIKALKFSNIYRAVLSEIIQATMRMAFINPLLNSMMGGSRPTMSGMFSVANMGGGSTGIVGGLAGLAGGVSGLAGIGSSISNFFGGSGGAASAASNYVGPGALADGAGFQAAGAGAAPAAAAGAGMGGMLGGMAMGFGMGSMVGGLIAGKSAARQQNAQIGAALGAVLLGPLGGLAGGAIGGMLGPRKARTFYNLAVDTDESGNFRVGAGGGKRADAQLAALRNETEQATKELNARMAALGLRASGSANLGSGVRGARQFGNLNDALNQFKITASDTRVQGAIDRLAGGDFNKALDVAAQTKEFIAALDSVKKELKDADDPIAQIVSQFDSLRESADKLGFGMDEVTTAQEKAIRAYREQQALGPVAGLADYARSLRIANDNSGTPMSRLASAELMFNETASLAASGDIRALGSLQDRAETFRQLSRDVFGTGIEFAGAEQRIIDALGTVGQLDTDQLTGDHIREQTETLVGALGRLQDEVKALRREVQQQGANPLTARAA